jgi:hypothetical protein
LPFIEVFKKKGFKVLLLQVESKKPRETEAAEFAVEKSALCLFSANLSWTSTRLLVSQHCHKHRTVNFFAQTLFAANPSGHPPARHDACLPWRLPQRQPSSAFPNNFCLCLNHIRSDDMGTNAEQSSKIG